MLNHKKVNKSETFSAWKIISQPTRYNQSLKKTCSLILLVQSNSSSGQDLCTAVSLSKTRSTKSVMWDFTLHFPTLYYGFQRKIWCKLSNAYWASLWQTGFSFQTFLLEISLSPLVGLNFTHFSQICFFALINYCERFFLLTFKYFQSKVKMCAPLVAQNIAESLQPLLKVGCTRICNIGFFFRI